MVRKPTKQQIKKTDIERQKLIALSKTAQEQAELLQITTGETLKINEILMINYKTETGCKTFRMFHEWKAEGYKVKKNETAFRIWGKPLKAKKAKLEESPSNEKAENENQKGYKLWPMCCLFNESQVEKIEEFTPVKENSNKSTDTPIVEPEDILHLETEQETVFKKNPYVCAEYEEQQENKRINLEERADKKIKESDNAYSRSHALVEHIPMGQPILVGHHSEKRHRNTLDKSWAAMGKSVKLGNEADDLISRAVSVGTGGIASDDPDALNQLKKKLKVLTDRQTHMKAINKGLRNNNDQILKALGYCEKQILELKKPDVSGHIGFMPYQLTNNNAKIKTVKKRLEGLEKLYKMPAIDFKSENFDMYVDDGRVRIKFHFGKPAEDVRQLMNKSYSFKFSRYSEEWVRKATYKAVVEAGLLCENLNELDAIY